MTFSTKTLIRQLIKLTIFSLSFACASSFATDHPWEYSDESLSLKDRIDAPEGYKRLPAKENSFTAWLRDIPIKKGNPSVMLFNGKKKFNQLAQSHVVDIDIGKRDLQQCADAVMRLRAEYLWSVGKRDKIAFNFTSGDRAKWSSWSKGIRPKIKGNKVEWKQTSKANDSYKNFRKYLDIVFTYAGSASLSRELKKVDNPSKVLPGDVFIQGGHPGHAVIVLDVAENKDGERVFLIAQSYMPAQNIHVLRNPKFWNGSWYKAKDSGKLVTPEWIFEYSDLMRF